MPVPAENSEGVEKSSDFARRAVVSPDARTLVGTLHMARETRELIVRMARENFLWGAPRIQGELLMLGFKVSRATVSRYMPPANRRPGQSWRTFLRNQAMAFRLNQSLEQDSDSEFLSLRNRSSCSGEAGRAGLNAARSFCAARSKCSIRVRRLGTAPHRSRNACEDHFPIQALTRSPPYHARASPRLRHRAHGGFVRIKF